MMKEKKYYKSNEYGEAVRIPASEYNPKENMEAQNIPHFEPPKQTEDRNEVIEQTISQQEENLDDKESKVKDIIKRLNQLKLSEQEMNKIEEEVKSYQKQKDEGEKNKEENENDRG